MRLTFSLKYILALLLIAIFSISAYLNLMKLTKSQESDGEIINKSGRQRMLSQKIALYVIKNDKQNLLRTIALMERSHGYLLKKSESKELKTLYFDKPYNLDLSVKKYLEHARNFAVSMDKKSYNYIINNSSVILTKLDRATSIYQKESGRRGFYGFLEFKISYKML